MRLSNTHIVAIVVLASLSGCVGQIFGTLPSTLEVDPNRVVPVSNDGAQLCKATPEPAEQPLRRLSHAEFENSASDLFTDAATRTLIASKANSFTTDTTSLGFTNIADFLGISSILAEQYNDAADLISEAAVKNISAILPCSPTGNEAGCASQFVNTFGRKLYRHALSAEESASLLAPYQKARTLGYDFNTGIEWVINAGLQSPRFLYRLELDAQASGFRKLTGYELAQRLSYLIWLSGPDDALLQAAERGALSTQADVEAEARRLLADAKSKRLTHFFDEFLEMSKLATFERNAQVFPNLPANFKDLMSGEMRAFVSSVVFDGSGSFNELLNAEYTMVNKDMSTHYGMASTTSTSFVKTNAPGRSGLLTQALSLTSHDKQTRTSIVGRGVMMKTKWLCEIVSPPPPNVSTDLGPVDATLSQAERLAQHRNNASCAGCHNGIDPLGQLFEGFDAVGRVRTVDEASKPIVTNSQVVGTKSLNGTYADSKAFSNAMAQSTQATGCFSTTLYRFSMGHVESADDDCSRAQAMQKFTQSNNNVRELIIALTQTDDFLYRRIMPQ